ncbi:hypothetical protein GBAR_LOCUS27333 [Geodia barretti]|uniref:Uncharacterized protein n=1 Tax=Geodia barretti TaxID=519541 RepID=A0AA35TMH3_GEOBA|nr:hypothetical protein GBAR_LOCUS27333 [Geodia barretti]
MVKAANSITSQGRSILSRLRVTGTGPRRTKAQTLSRDMNFTSPCLPERFTRRQLSISHSHPSSSVSMDDIYLAAGPSLAASPYTANFIDALMAPRGRPLSLRRDSAPITSVAKTGVEVRSNDSSMDRVFEEKEEEEGEGERERGGAGGGRGGLGVEPVLATSYSANDVSHLREEDGSLQILVPSVTKTSTGDGHLKVNGSIPESRSIPYQPSDQKETLLHIPNFLPPMPNTPKLNLDINMSPRGTTSFEFESINLRKVDPGFLHSSTESMHSTASN